MKKVLYVLLSPLTYWVSCLVPKGRKKVAIGSWCGKIFADNPKYLYLYLSKYVNCDVRWIGELSPGGGIRFLRRNSFRSLWFLMRAKTWVCCQGVNDLTDFAPYGGRVQIMNWWHGVPLKYMGELSPGKGVGAVHIGWHWRLIHFIVKMISCTFPRPKEYVTSSSPDMTDIMARCFPGRFVHERTLPLGSPRIDFLLHNKDNRILQNKIKKKYADIIGFNAADRIVLYAPTWRLTGSGVFSFSSMSLKTREELNAILEKKGAVVIEKFHPNSYRQLHCDGIERCNRIVTVPQAQLPLVDIQELLLVTDVLVTDYSSLYFDYAILKRPCCHYVYDYEEYASNDSGLAYDMKDVAGGPMLRDESSLVDYIGKALLSNNFKPGEKLASLMEYESGSACHDFLQRFLGGVV